MTHILSSLYYERIRIPPAELSASGEIRKIRVDDIESGTEQVRTEVEQEGIDELADNIKKWGLLNPITVYGPTSSGKYEVIAGQRRLLAHKKLGLEFIEARVLTNKPSDIEAKSISFVENMMRRPLRRVEARNLVLLLVRRYGGDTRAVAEQLAMPYKEVREFVAFDKLDPTLQTMVDNGEVDLRDATKAQKAATTSDGSVDSERAVGLAREMKALIPEAKKVLVQKAQEEPEASIDTLVEAAKKPQKRFKVTATLEPNEYEGLKKAEKDIQAENDDEAASRGLVEWLESGGYLSEN